MPEQQSTLPVTDPATTTTASTTTTTVTTRREELRQGLNSRTDVRGAFDINNETDAALSTTIFALFVVSIIEFGTAADLCDAADNCDEGRPAWSVAVGVISAAFCIIWLILRHLAKVEMPPMVEVCLACLMIILWAFGVGFSTDVEGPFAITNNGYFASWLALLLSVLYLAHAYVRKSHENYHVTQTHHSLLIVFLGSIVEMAVAADFCDQDGVDCDGRRAWAVAVGAIAAALCIVQLIISHCAYNVAQASGRVIGSLLLLLWIFGAAFNTSIPDGPFNSACANANGYYATWVAFGASVVYFWRVVIQNMPEENA